MAVRILVVDDDRAVRDSLRRSLSFNGYAVSLAQDGVEALEVKHHHAPLASLDKTEPAVIHVADALAVGLGYTLKGSIHLGTVEREVWETVGLGPGDLAEVVDEGERQIAAIMRAFFGPE